MNMLVECLEEGAPRVGSMVWEVDVLEKWHLGVNALAYCLRVETFAR